MGAATIAELYDFENAFEVPAETFLNTATGISVVGTLSEADFTTPRIEVAFEVGEAVHPPPERGGGASATTRDYRNFNGVFTARIVTDNAVGQTVDHSTYRNKVRAALALSGDNWTSGGTAGNVTLTGTGEIAEDATTLEGTGAAFTTELTAGDGIAVGGVPFTVSTITDNDTLTTTTAAASTIGPGAALLRTYSPSDGPNLPYWTMSLCRPTGTVSETSEDFNVSELSYEIIYSIRDDAWPS